MNTIILYAILYLPTILVVATLEVRRALQLRKLRSESQTSLERCIAGLDKIIEDHRQWEEQHMCKHCGHVHFFPPCGPVVSSVKETFVDRPLYALAE